MSRVDSKRARGYTLLFAGMALVGTYVALSKPLTAAIPVFLLATLRFGIASIVMIPWLARGPNEAPVDAELARALFLQSFFGNFLFSITMLFGVSMTSASSAGVILSTLPAMVAVQSWLFLRERLDARTWAAIAFAVVGIGLLTLVRSAPAAGGDSVAGNLLIFACVGCEAVYVILGKKLTTRMSPRRISALINLCGLVLMLPFGLWQARDFDFGAVSIGVWALLVFYAVSASTLSTWLWLTGQKTVPASHSGVFTIALPLAACLVGVLVLGEQFGWLHGLAFMFAMTGIVLITTARHPSTEAEKTAAENPAVSKVPV